MGHHEEPETRPLAQISALHKVENKHAPSAGDDAPCQIKSQIIVSSDHVGNNFLSAIQQGTIKTSFMVSGDAFPLTTSRVVGLIDLFWERGCFKVIFNH